MNITEITVMNFYKSIEINNPYQLLISNISEKTYMPVMIWEHSSEVVRWRSKIKMFLNKDLNEQQKWQEFGHELKHVLLDVGRQELLPMSFVLLLED